MVRANARAKEMAMTRCGILLGRAAVAALLCAAVPAGAAVVAGNRITGVELDPSGKLVIHGSAKPSFTVFKLAEPPRLVIDLEGADVTSVASPIDLQKGGIAGVTTAQFDESGSRVARIVVALTGDVRYDVSAAGSDLLVQIGEPSPAPAAPKGDVAPAAPAAPLAQTDAAAPASAAASNNVVTTREDERKVRHPAKKVGRVSVSDEAGVARVSIGADGEIAHYTLIELKEPGRLALDLHGVVGRGHQVDGKGVVKSVRVARHLDGVRVVVDGATAAFPAYEVNRTARGLEVRAYAKVVASAEPGPSEAVVRAPEQPGMKSPALVAVRTVDLRTEGARTEVAIALAAPVKFEVVRPDEKTAVLTLHGALLPTRLERNLDASALGGDLKMLSCFRVPGSSGEVRVIAAVKPGTSNTIEASKTGLSWSFFGTAGAAQTASALAPRAAAMASEQKALTQSTVLDERNYTGRRADFNLKDIEIKNLLSGIAEISKRNIIVADDVKGTVTIKLRNVPWDQALDIILKAKGLGKEEVGNIIRVAPIERLRAEQKDAAEAAKLKNALDPLKVRLIPVNYATAGSLVDKIKDALTERGTVSVDTRTNTLVVKDVQDSLVRAEGIVRNLDTQTPEVLIESRIVEASTSFSRQVGIQWGGNVSFSPVTGNPTGLVFPNILQVAGAADDSAAPTGGLNGVTQPNFAVNMPAPIGMNNGAGLGFIFGSAGGAANLNLRLSAAENSGTIKTISSPRVVALDNVESSIGQGVSIPFSQVSAAGVNTTFIEAKLELKVTPHVTQEGSIQMKISATNNQPNPQLTGANGQPSISRREAKTEVLVKDGDTTVIGGIYTRTNSESWNEVPVLSRIPILGWLFKKKAVQDARTELLIFITPRIVNRNQSIVAGGSGDEKP
jgi:type IV pilus assembly protein PilQ